jgi:hypothetical protein
MVTRERGSLALGLPYAGNTAAIVDAVLNFLPPGRSASRRFPAYSLRSAISTSPS